LWFVYLNCLLGPGALFGAVDLFNKATTNIANFRSIENDLALDDSVITAKIKKGAFVRISMADFLEHVMVEDKEEEERKAQAEDSKIAEIPWYELTDDDKFYIKVYKRVRELVNKNIFALLNSYKMVPKNSRTPAYKYFHETEIYREIHVDQSEPPSVYIIISGRIRVEVETIRNKEKKPHTIACKRKGKKPMVVKVSVVSLLLSRLILHQTFTMPILLLDEGSLLCLRDETFSIGKLGEENKVIKPSKDGSLTRSELLQAMKEAQTPDVLKGSTQVDSNNRTPIESLYRIKLLVESTCSYLKYPYAFFAGILDDEKRILKSIADGIP
jgi:hypothetical protein